METKETNTKMFLVLPPRTLRAPGLEGREEEAEVFVAPGSDHLSGWWGL